MAPSGELTSSEVLALLKDGGLAGSWTLDGARSSVLLKTRHTWGLRPLDGVFGEVAGSGTITEAGDVTGVINVAAESIDTKEPQRDKHLRSAAFFDVAHHPNFTFTADGASPAGEGVRIAGTLTVRGTTRPVSFDAKVSADDDGLTLDGELPLNRADYGLTKTFLGMAPLRVTIVVHAVFTRHKRE